MATCRCQHVDEHLCVGNIDGACFTTVLSRVWSRLTCCMEFCPFPSKSLFSHSFSAKQREQGEKKHDFLLARIYERQIKAVDRIRSVPVVREQRPQKTCNTCIAESSPAACGVHGQAHHGALCRVALPSAAAFAMSDASRAVLRT